MPSKAIEVFYSYAHKDEKLRDKLEIHLANLKQQALITNWHDREISAGSEWSLEINEHLNAAQIILLLVSPDFIASDYCYNIEVKRALERHEAGEACVIPIILRHASWKRTPLSKLQALPTDGRPVMSWSDKDKAFLDIEVGIWKAIEERWPDESRKERTAQLLRRDTDKNLSRDNDALDVSINLTQTQKPDTPSHFKHDGESQAILNTPRAKFGDFNTGFDHSFLNGKIAAIICELNGELLGSIVDADEPFYVDVAWQLQGHLASMICGKWSVKLYFESLTSNTDFMIPGDEGLIDLNPCGDGYYKARITIPANKVSEEQSAGPYQAIVVLQYYKLCKIKHGSDDTAFMPGPLAAIVTLPIMEFYY